MCRTAQRRERTARRSYDCQTVTAERRAISTCGHGVTICRRGANEEWRGVTTGRQGVAIERRAITTDGQGITTRCRADTTERRFNMNNTETNGRAAMPSRCDVGSTRSIVAPS